MIFETRQGKVLNSDNMKSAIGQQLILSSLLGKNFEMPSAFFDQDVADIGNMQWSLSIERKMINYEDQFIDMDACPEVGKNGGDAFIQKLKNIIRLHAASKHPFYEEYLPKQASVTDIAFYLAQETQLDPRFDDFIAYMQVGLPLTPKRELAQNYWDELGGGNASRVHVVMFQKTLDEVGVSESFIKENLLY